MTEDEKQRNIILLQSLLNSRTERKSLILVDDAYNRNPWFCFTGSQIGHVHYYFERRQWGIDKFACTPFSAVMEPYRSILKECVQVIEFCGRLEGKE